MHFHGHSISVATGFIVLGFFVVLLNAGINTFYQNNIPVDLMGRVTSIFQLIQSVAQVILLFIVGLLGDFISLRMTIIGLASMMFLLSIVYLFFVFNAKYKLLYDG